MEQIILTPKSKTATCTILLIERCVIKEDQLNGNIHVAGGEHRGIVINKAVFNGNATEISSTADIKLEFRVYLVNATTGHHVRECRTLRFWFKSCSIVSERSTVAQHFFKDLVSPKEFPRDYVGFIKKIMKLMQYEYTDLEKLEVTLKQLDESTTIPKRPLSAEETTLSDKTEKLTEQKLLELIESSYPNPLTAEEVVEQYGWNKEEVLENLEKLRSKGIVKMLDYGAFTRVAQHDTQIQVVKQMPIIAHSKQPTIAIITAQYCEKVAVDALIDNKETFVRYTTLGESNVYTLGNIGQHRVVCTKLPTTGHTREAMIAAGNTTTRLLGTFQKVDYVLLVGVGGGVPHYTDYKKHVRLGDVVVSCNNDAKYVYTYCEKAKFNEKTGTFDFEYKEYHPKNLLLQDIALQLKLKSEEGELPWLSYLTTGIEDLKSDIGQDFSRPASDSDRLYMCVGDNAIIEVAHPIPLDGEKEFDGMPRIHTGPIASGRAISKDEQLRQAFALQCNALAFDSEFDSVIESVIGSCRDSFIAVRGIADYRDGTRRSEWQPFASVSAAAVARAIISILPL